MKTPCELIVWYVLPQIRQELAKELIFKHGLTQVRTARLLGLSSPAISNYMNSKKRISEESQEYPGQKEFKKEVEWAAQRIIDGSNVVVETCRLCEIIKKSNLINYINKTYNDEKPVSQI
jgi:predicted transcriptional regulator